LICSACSILGYRQIKEVDKLLIALGHIFFHTNSKAEEVEFKIDNGDSNRWKRV